MTVLRNSALVTAPARTVAAALLDAGLVTGSAARAGCPARIVRGEGVLAVGDELRLGLPVLPGLCLPVTLRVVDVGVTGVLCRAVSGPFRRFELRTELVETAGGVLVVDGVTAVAGGGPLGELLATLVLRRPVLRLLTMRATALRERAGGYASARVVVGAAIVRQGMLLAQQRAYPERDCGRWELPGGRVEQGESEPDAVVRECREELGVEVRVGAPVGPDLPLSGGLLLRVYAAELVGDGEPAAVEHTALRWVDVAGLGALDWLAADRALLPALRGLLRRSVR
jgi:8-oxo-dGTP diphosphatase